MTVYTHSYDSDYEPAMPVVEMGVGDIDGGKEVIITAMIDSGADATMIPLAVIKEVGALFIRERRMYGTTGSGKKVNTYLVVIRVGPYTLYGIEAVGMVGGKEALLGRDVLNQLVVTLNGLANETQITA
jgi:predicted aspartyl protease